MWLSVITSNEVTAGRALQQPARHSTDTNDVMALNTVDRPHYSRVSKWKIRPEHGYALHIFFELLIQQIFSACH